MMVREPYTSQVELFEVEVERDIDNSYVNEQEDEDELIAQAMVALPVIAKRLFASLIEHPFASGLPHSQIKAMGHLFKHSPSTLSEVADALGVSLPTASELIERLVEEGMVSRDTNPADRRKVVLALTPRAREMGQQIHAIRRAQIRAVMDRLEPDERPVFVKSIQALADVLMADVQSLPGCLFETGHAQPQATQTAGVASPSQTITGEGRSLEG
jgi:DNA-binding MarR family transcriptional regulator